MNKIVEHSPTLTHLYTRTIRSILVSRRVSYLEFGYRVVGPRDGSIVKLKPL